MVGYLFYSPPHSAFSPEDLVTLKAASPPSLPLPPFDASPAILKERASEIAADMGFLLRRYDAVIYERTKLKLLPAVCFSENLCYESD